MKTFLMLLFVLGVAACADERHSGFTVKMRDAPELRFSGSPYTVNIKGSTLEATHMGRTILYENGDLHVDGRLVDLPARARVVTFEGADIYIDGRRRE